MAISRMNMERQMRNMGGIMSLEDQRQGYGNNPSDKGGSDTMGSSKDGGIIGYGGTSGTPLYQQFMNGGLADLVDIYD